MPSISSLKKLEVRTSPKVVVILTSILICIGQFLFIMEILDKRNFQNVLILRQAHVFISLMILAYALFTKRKWTQFHGPFLFVILFIPLMVIGWFNQIAIASSDVLWKPFGGFPPIFFALSILVAGSYLVNFILMAIFTIEVAALWFYLMPQFQKNVLLSGEPYDVMLFAISAFCLLLFRYQDERTFRKLMKQQARSEFIENLARTFLSLRDRSNTPLQALYFLVEILKRKRTVTDQDIEIFEKSIQRLNQLNKKLIRYESHVPWAKELMTDEEIDHWLKELELELQHFKPHG